MRRLGGGKDSRGFAHQGSGYPQGAGAVQEKFYRRRHISKTGRTAEDQTAALLEIIMGCKRRPLVRHRRVELESCGRDGGNRAESRLHTRNRFDAAANLSSQRGGASLAGIIQNQYFVH